MTMRSVTPATLLSGPTPTNHETLVNPTLSPASLNETAFVVRPQISLARQNGLADVGVKRVSKGFHPSRVQRV
jgi:hypothetical protein